ncbi:MAG: CDP-glucose 4,6-dehydratase [Bacteroidales bacterium]|nr:CDP-glucose 4,6-dehydratase [Bacteroidales bacterium]
MTDIFQQFYKNKTILVTGHTGFKGSWLTIWLHELGAKVIGLSLDPITEKDNFVLTGLSQKITDLRGDIRDAATVNAVFDKYKPEMVFHLAAQPIVRLSYEQPVETYQTNVMGTLNVMEAFRKCNAARVAVMITTDKCYENREQIWGYRENEPMGGYDPYSSSKGAAEIAISSWRRSFMNPEKYEQHHKSIASVRAGNVIGGGDWAQDRIIPDCIRALEVGQPIAIRNRTAVRPWQHVLEPLSGYLLLGQKMWEEPTRFCEGWNFGPNAESLATVWDIATLLIQNYGSGTLQDASDPNAVHEANLLMLDISKARFRLNWHPRLNLAQTAALTADWYLRYRNEDVYNLCVKQIEQYLQ